MMKKELEDYLWERIRPAGVIDNPHRWPRDIIKEMLNLGMIKSPKQAWATLEKWCDKGIYEYGVNLDLGWKVESRKGGTG